MKNNVLSIPAITGVFLSSILFVSCNATGPSFQPVSPPPGQGVVYIYRQPKHAGSTVYGTVKADNKPITKIKSGGYYPYLGAPGDTRFTVTTEAANEATVRVEAGKSKYLKTTMVAGHFVLRLKLTEVAPEIGMGEIGACKLLETAVP